MPTSLHTTAIRTLSTTRSGRPMRTSRHRHKLPKTSRANLNLSLTKNRARLRSSAGPPTNPPTCPPFPPPSSQALIQRYRARSPSASTPTRGPGTPMRRNHPLRSNRSPVIQSRSNIVRSTAPSTTPTPLSQRPQTARQGESQTPTLQW